MRFEINLKNKKLVVRDAVVEHCGTTPIMQGNEERQGARLPSIRGKGKKMKAYDWNCPCNGCEKRNAECHANCTAYKDWKKSGIEIVEPYIERKKRKYKFNRRWSK